MLVAEGLHVHLSGWQPPTLLPPCRETPWKELRCLLDVPTLMFLSEQVSAHMYAAKEATWTRTQNSVSCVFFAVFVAFSSISMTHQHKTDLFVVSGFVVYGAACDCSAERVCPELTEINRCNKI